MACLASSFAAVLVGHGLGLGGTTITETVLGQIAKIICTAAPSSSTEAKLGAKKMGGTDVEAHGWIVENGHLVYV